MTSSVNLYDWVNNLARLVETTCSRAEVLNSLKPQEPGFFGEFTSSIAILVAERERRNSAEVALELYNRIPLSLRVKTQVVRSFLNLEIEDFTHVYSVFGEIKEPELVIIHVLPPTKSQSYESYMRLIARALFFLLRCTFSGQRAFLRVGTLDENLLVEIDATDLGSLCKLFVDIISSRSNESETPFFRNRIQSDILANCSQSSTVNNYLWLLPNTFSQQDFRSIVARVKASGGTVWVPVNSWAELSPCPFTASNLNEWNHNVTLNFISYLAGDTFSKDIDYHVPLFEERANCRWFWGHTLSRLNRGLSCFRESFEVESKAIVEWLADKSFLNRSNFGEEDYLKIASFWCRIPCADRILGRSGNLSLQLQIEHFLLLALHRVLNYSQGQLSEYNVKLLRIVLNLVKQDRYWLRLCQ